MGMPLDGEEVGERQKRSYFTFRPESKIKKILFYLRNISILSMEATLNRPPQRGGLFVINLHQVIPSRPHPAYALGRLCPYR